MRKKVRANKTSPLVCIISANLAAAAGFLILLGICAAIVLNADIKSENYMYLTLLCCTASSFISSAVTAAAANRRKFALALLSGAAASLLLFLILICFNRGKTESPLVFLSLPIALIGSLLGGVFSVCVTKK